MNSVLIPDLDVCPHFSYASRLGELNLRLYTYSPYYLPKNYFGQKHRHSVLPGDFYGGIATDHGRFEYQCNFISNLINENEIAFGLCGTDRNLKAFYEIEKVEKKFKLCAPSFRLFDILSSKLKARSLFEDSGFVVPKGRAFYVDSGDEIDIKSVKFPCIFKRDTSENSNAVRYVENLEELMENIKISYILNKNFLIEEFLGKGKEYSYQFFIFKGGLYPIYSLEKLSHLKTSFSTAVRQLSKMEEAELFSVMKEKFENALGEGLYSAQFKKRPDGTLSLIEVNARLGNNYRIINRMFPELTECIFKFYTKDESWLDIYEKIQKQKQKPAYGVSIIEDIFGRVQRSRIGGKRVFRKELHELFRLMGNRPFLDDYLLGMIFNTRISLKYYRDFLKFYRLDAANRNNSLKMVQS